MRRGLPPQRQSIKKLPSTKTLPSVKKSLASTSSIPKSKYPISPPKTPGDSSVRVSKIKSTSKIAPPKPDIIIVNAINSIFKNEQTKTSFVHVFSATQQVDDNNTISKLFAHFREQILDKLDFLKIVTVEDLIDHYDLFNSQISKIQSFMKFLGRKNILDSRNNLPIWKFNEELAKHENKCFTIARELWLDHVHKRVLNDLSKEIKIIFQNLVKNNNSQSESIVQRLYAIFKDLGLDYIQSVSDLFNMTYNIEHKDKSPSEKLQFLMYDLNRLSQVFPMEKLQELIFLNHIDDFLVPLLKNRDDVLLPMLPEFITPNLASEYSKKVVEYMESVSLPVDFFSLAEFLRYFSSIIPNSLPVRKYVGNYLNRTTTNFPSSLAFVFFAHIELTDNLKPLANLIPLYTNQDDISDEINKYLMKRLLQHRSSDITLERKLIETLKSVVGRDLVRTASLILNNYKITDNMMIVCKPLWIRVIPDDSIKLPKEMEQSLNVLTQKYKSYYQKVQLSGIYSTVNVNCKYEKEEKTVIMSILQYNIIKLLESGITMVQDMGTTTEIVKKHMKPLIKAKFICKVPGGFSISKTPISGKKINVYEYTIKSKKSQVKKKEKKTEEKPPEDHLNGVRAAAIKIMKNENKLSRDSLKKSILQITSKLFETYDDEMNRAIKSLIFDQYLSVDKNDENILHYVP
ncbi:hypothetical protein TVAG_420320 [Trichomonas vaginalis G3]|uniref:Cullin family profile domain-containing protein n=1 Tax=Trichomonas vaginalis (strain ATCC PRA-98 / G3) TaxID=412133 RepID=A2ED55_TRIV3|nr:Cullin homology domain family [Trichomonas vaginalis G3]EAY09410.1 hypothetical protein TVAG_420320 [Trichomonas vaginalis G3]KAI5536330.1 Cullin homology domain family [Trichomonas vaginalis G3]|eukprot:XP_001321633.1 hypothetical protein [Trichomonas vaginalis G3]